MSPSAARSLVVVVAVLVDVVVVFVAVLVEAVVVAIVVDEASS